MVRCWCGKSAELAGFDRVLMWGVGRTGRGQVMVWEEGGMAGDQVHPWDV